MGGLTAWGRVTLGAAAAGVLGGTLLHVTGSAADHERAARAQRNEGLYASQREHPGDGLSDNLDGVLRLGALGTALGAAAVAGVSRLAHRPGIAAWGVGIALGTAGAALLTGDGSPNDRLVHNLGSAGSALSARLHATLLPRRPDVAAQRPASDPTPSPTRPSPRPDAASVEAAHIELMPGVPDEALAQQQAARALAQVDWARPDIVLWVPGTNDHLMAGNWKRHVERDLARPASAVLIDYPATMDFAPSVSTGMRTLQLVLAGIARHGGNHRVLVGGHSQGAWIVGDAMATPQIRASVDRAALFGNPGLAGRHYADRHDAKVMELDDANDPITFPVRDRALLLAGSRDFGAGAMLQHPLRSIAVAAQNPMLVSFWAARTIDSERWAGNDPHEYYSSYAPAIDWLDAAPMR